MSKKPTRLVVQSPFGGHEHGALIDDPKVVAAILAGPNAGHVLNIGPAPAAEKEG